MKRRDFIAPIRTPGRNHRKVCARATRPVSSICRMRRRKDEAPGIA